MPAKKVSNKSKKTKPKKVKVSVVELKHRQVIKNIGKCGSITEAAKKAGYTENYAKSGNLTKTDTWNELLEKVMPDEKLAKCHEEGLKAVTKIHKIVDRDEDGKPIYDFIDVEDYGTRHRYLDTAYKLKKKYDESITVNHGIAGTDDKVLAEEFTRIISGLSKGLGDLQRVKAKGKK